MTISIFTQLVLTYDLIGIDFVLQSILALGNAVNPYMEPRKQNFIDSYGGEFCSRLYAG